jgi:heme-degrading monooxygenase HmoA
MIRVVYRFAAGPGQEEVFANAWSRATRSIRDRAPGSRGSQLFRSADDPREFVALARWESIDAWRTFRSGEPADPGAIAAMLSVAEVTSIEVLEEVDDLLLESS